MAVHWHGNGVRLVSMEYCYNPLSSSEEYGARLLGGVMQRETQKERGGGVLPLKLRANRYELALKLLFSLGLWWGWHLKRTSERRRRKKKEAGEARWNDSRVFCLFTFEENDLTQHWWLNLLCWGQK